MFSAILGQTVKIKHLAFFEIIYEPPYHEWTPSEEDILRKASPPCRTRKAHFHVLLELSKRTFQGPIESIYRKFCSSRYGFRITHGRNFESMIKYFATRRALIYTKNEWTVFPELKKWWENRQQQCREQREARAQNAGSAVKTRTDIALSSTAAVRPTPLWLDRLSELSKQIPVEEEEPVNEGYQPNDESGAIPQSLSPPTASALTTTGAAALTVTNERTERRELSDEVTECIVIVSGFIDRCFRCYGFTSR